MPRSRTGVVPAVFDAYRTQDREAADRLMAEELAFTGLT